MPLPTVVDGNIDDQIETIRNVGKMGLENIVQGHGDIILRGEIEEAVRENLAYLAALKKVIKAALRKREPEEFLDGVDIESCGKSRVYLGGLAGELHRRNLKALYNRAVAEAALNNEVIELEKTEE